MRDFFNFGVIGLYAGGSAPYNPTFENSSLSSLEGVQSASIGLNYPRQDNVAWDGMGDQVLVERPTADLSFSYIYASGVNESKLGLFSSPGNLTSALINLNTERNFYLAYNEGGHDLIGGTSANAKVMAFGNGLLSRYDFAATVGQPTMVSANIQALNLLFQPSGSGQILPAIGKQSGDASVGIYSLPPAQATITDFFIARPASITLAFNSGCAVGIALSGANSCPLQSFGFTIDAPRQPVKDIGWAYPQERPVAWPVTVSIHANGYLTQFQTDAINRLNCPDSGVDLDVHFKNSCSSTDGYAFSFHGAKLTSESIGSSVGSFTQFSLGWTMKIYDLNRSYPQFFIDNPGTSYTSLEFPQIEYTSGNAPLTFEFGAPYYFTVLSGPGTLMANSLTFLTNAPDTVAVGAVPASGGTTETVTVSYSP